MTKFKIILNTNEITLSNEWTPATKFNCRGKPVDVRGKKVATHYTGTRYRIIEKRERSFTSLERVGRGFLGVLAVVSILCAVLFPKFVTKLFTKSKTSIRFAVLDDNTRFKLQDGEIVYLAPQLLFGGNKISEKLNFALIKRDGKQSLVPITKNNKYEEYTTYEGSAAEALLKIAQDKTYGGIFSNRHCGSPILYLLKHPNNSIITEEEFINFILEKDGTETPRIFTLNFESTLEVLSLIKEKNIHIDLQEKTPKGKTLFAQWAGKGHLSITKLLLELDPSVIEQIKDKKESVIADAILNDSPEEADLLIEAKLKRNIPLSEEEVWLQRAAKNSCDFSEDEFISLSQEFKTKIFFVANAFANENLIKKLKSLGMDEKPLFPPGPSILARNMDLLTTRDTISDFLKGLRQQGLLLTSEEFKKLDQSQYLSKSDQIGRILGKNFIEKLVEENHLKHIKVPKKIAVIQEGVENLSFMFMENSLEPIPKTNQLKIYAEKVKPVNRKLSLEEAIEFMIILEKTGYGDFFGDNFFYCEDGIYFIDTEYKDFKPIKPNFAAIKSIQENLDPKDREPFLVAYEKRKEAFEKQNEWHDDQKNPYRTFFENPYKELTSAYALHEFTYQVDSLLSSS